MASQYRDGAKGLPVFFLSKPVYLERSMAIKPRTWSKYYRLHCFVVLNRQWLVAFSVILC